MKDLKVVLDSSLERPFRVDSTGALLVEGLEGWIGQLVPVLGQLFGQPPIEDGALYLQDAKTGAVFLVRRVK